MNLAVIIFLVLCCLLMYILPAAGGVSLSYNSYSNQVYWVLTMRCQGDEVTLSECVINQNITTPCESLRDVGALCFALESGMNTQVIARLHMNFV